MWACVCAVHTVYIKGSRWSSLGNHPRIFTEIQDIIYCNCSLFSFRIPEWCCRRKLPTRRTVFSSTNSKFWPPEQGTFKWFVIRYNLLLWTAFRNCNISGSLLGRSGNAYQVIVLAKISTKYTYTQVILILTVCQCILIKMRVYMASLMSNIILYRVLSAVNSKI